MGSGVTSSQPGGVVPAPLPVVIALGGDAVTSFDGGAMGDGGNVPSAPSVGACEVGVAGDCSPGLIPRPEHPTRSANIAAPTSRPVTTATSHLQHYAIER